MYSDTKGIASDNFVVIQGWMCNELNLKGNDLLVFALIYGFCQDGKSMYSGGRKYIAETFNISLRTVDGTLKALTERGYIVKHISGDYIHPDIYTVNGVKDTLIGGSEKTSLGVAQKLHEGGAKIAPNNTSNKIIDNINTFTNVKVAQPTVTPIQNKPKSASKRKPLIKSVNDNESVSDIDINSANSSNISANDTSNRQITSNTSITSNMGVVSPIKKKNLYEKCMDEIDAYTDDEEIKDLLKTYLPIRFARKDIVINLPTFRGMLKTLNRVAETRECKIESIQQSIDRQYPTFYAPHKRGGYDSRKKFAEGSKGLKNIHANTQEDLDDVL